MGSDAMQVRDAASSCGVEMCADEVPAGYKRTEIGMVPADWKTKPLEDIATIAMGRTPSRQNSAFWGRGHVWLSIADLNGKVVDKSSEQITDLAAASMRRVAKGTLLMSFKLSIGRLSFAGCDLFTNEAICSFTDLRANAEYLYYALGRTDFTLYGKRAVKGYTLNSESLRAVEVILPEAEEQTAIAAALSDVDGLLGALEALVAKKQAIKRAAMQQLLTGKTRLPGFRGAWETKRLGEIAELHRHNIVPAATGDELFTHFSLPAFDDGQIPVIEPGSAIGSNKFRVPDNAVLVSKLNPRIPRVWMPRGIVQNAVASTEFLVLTPRRGTSRLFLFILCTSLEFCERLELAATGTTGSHQRVAPSDAMKIGVRVPPKADEQTAIATVLSDMDAEIAALEARRDKTRAIKQGMMQQLLTGRVRLVKPTPRETAS